MPEPQALIFHLNALLAGAAQLYQWAWRDVPGPAGPAAAADRAHCAAPSGQLLGGTREQAGEQFLALQAEARRRFSVGVGEWVTPVAGAEALLASARRNRRLAVVTPLPLKCVGELLKHAGWRNAFEILVGAEHLNEPASEDALLRAALERLKLPPYACVGFAATAGAVRAARTAGIPVCALAVTEARWRLVAAGADWVLRDYQPTPPLTRVLAGQRPSAMRRWSQVLFS